MKRYIIFFAGFFYYQLGLAQNSISLYQHTFPGDPRLNFIPADSGIRVNINSLNKTGSPSPYTTNLIKDGLVITAATGVTLPGYELIENKKNLTNAELAGKTKDKLPFFDRGNAGYYSPQANKDKLYTF